jgi:hypothetical protein
LVLAVLGQGIQNELGTVFANREAIFAIGSTPWNARYGGQVNDAYDVWGKGLFEGGSVSDVALDMVE